MKKIFVRNPYNYDMDEASLESSLECLDKSLTQQSFKDECDINVIVERFGLTGEMPQVRELGEYGDFTGIFDFQTAMNTIRQAQEAFDAWPAHIRARFHNQPQELLDFLADEENRPEAVKLGLVAAPPPQEATPPAEKAAPPSKAS